MALAAAIPYILQGASLLGGLFGRKKKRSIDPEYLRTHFGPEAIVARAQELSQRILSSPYGQQLMASAAESGQGLQTEMARRSAESGLSPDTGAGGGASDFATSAATQAQGAFERGAKSNIWQQAMPVAQDLVAQELAAYRDQLNLANEEPTMIGRIGQVASGAAAMFPTQRTSVVTGDLGNKAPSAPNAGQPLAAPVTSQVPVPQLAFAPQSPSFRMVGNPAPAEFSNALPRALSMQRPQMGAVRRGRGSLAYSVLR